jgi:ADP-heptose:LPS heptosyltransferase
LPSSIERRLIIRPGAIGDFIVSLPALLHLRAPYTELWTGEANLPLARFSDASRTIIAAGLDRLGLLPADDVIARLREFDSIVSWYGANRPDFRHLVAGLGLPFVFHEALPPSATIMHAVDYYSSQVGVRAGAIPSLETGTVQRHGSIVIHPFASSPEKRWPGAIDFHPPGMQIVRLRGPEEQLAGALHIPDLFDLACFLAGARAYIGNDSGITHLAAAVGVPTIALFGPTDPAVWGPRGKAVRIVRAPKLSDITPEMVIDALHDFGIY